MGIFIYDASQYLPYGVLTWIFKSVRGLGSGPLHENGKHAREVAKKLIDVKRKNMQNGEVGKDVLSLLSECFWWFERFAHRWSVGFLEQLGGLEMLMGK